MSLTSGRLSGQKFAGVVVFDGVRQSARLSQLSPKKRGGATAGTPSQEKCGGGRTITSWMGGGSGSGECHGNVTCGHV